MSLSQPFQNLLDQGKSVLSQVQAGRPDIPSLSPEPDRRVVLSLLSYFAQRSSVVGATGPSFPRSHFVSDDVAQLGRQTNPDRSERQSMSSLPSSLSSLATQGNPALSWPSSAPRPPTVDEEKIKQRIRELEEQQNKLREAMMSPSSLSSSSSSSSLSSLSSSVPPHTTQSDQEVTAHTSLIGPVLSRFEQKGGGGGGGHQMTGTSVTSRGSAGSLRRPPFGTNADSSGRGSEAGGGGRAGAVTYPMSQGTMPIGKLGSGVGGMTRSVQDHESELARLQAVERDLQSRLNEQSRTILEQRKQLTEVREALEERTDEVRKLTGAIKRLEQASQVRQPKGPNQASHQESSQRHPSSAHTTLQIHGKYSGGGEDERIQATLLARGRLMGRVAMCLASSASSSEGVLRHVKGELDSLADRVIQEEHSHTDQPLHSSHPGKIGLAMADLSDRLSRAMAGVKTTNQFIQGTAAQMGFRSSTKDDEVSDIINIFNDVNASGIPRTKTGAKGRGGKGVGARMTVLVQNLRDALIAALPSLSQAITHLTACDACTVIESSSINKSKGLKSNGGLRLAVPTQGSLDAVTRALNALRCASEACDDYLNTDVVNTKVKGWAMWESGLIKETQDLASASDEPTNIPITDAIASLNAPLARPLIQTSGGTIMSILSPKVYDAQERSLLHKLGLSGGAVDDSQLEGSSVSEERNPYGNSIIDTSLRRRPSLVLDEGKQDLLFTFLKHVRRQILTNYVNYHALLLQRTTLGKVVGAHTLVAKELVNKAANVMKLMFNGLIDSANDMEEACLAVAGAPGRMTQGGGVERLVSVTSIAVGKIRNLAKAEAEAGAGSPPPGREVEQYDRILKTAVRAYTVALNTLQRQIHGVGGGSAEAKGEGDPQNEALHDTGDNHDKGNDGVYAIKRKQPDKDKAKEHKPKRWIGPLDNEGDGHEDERDSESGGDKEVNRGSSWHERKSGERCREMFEARIGSKPKVNTREGSDKPLNVERQYGKNKSTEEQREQATHEELHEEVREDDQSERTMTEVIAMDTSSGENTLKALNRPLAADALDIADSPLPNGGNADEDMVDAGHVQTKVNMPSTLPQRQPTHRVRPVNTSRKSQAQGTTSQQEQRRWSRQQYNTWEDDAQWPQEVFSRSDDGQKEAEQEREPMVHHNIQPDMLDVGTEGEGILLGSTLERRGLLNELQRLQEMLDRSP